MYWGLWICGADKPRDAVWLPSCVEQVAETLWEQWQGASDVFKNVDPAYSSKLLAAAVKAYE
jgi:hypothetical protein